jgi:signal transduction histidine kinase
MVDITERKAAEQALRISEEKFRRIVENIGIGVALISSDARILEMNRQMREWFPNAEPGKPTLCYQQFRSRSQNKPCHDCPTMEAIATGRLCETRVYSTENSERRCFRIIASPILGSSGKVSAAIELVEDITQKNALERELHQAQKLESIGQLAAGIAHEINTPIQYVGDNVRFLEDAFGDLSAVLKAYARLLDIARKEPANQDIVKEVDSASVAADIPYLSEEIPSAIEQSLEGVQRVSKIIQAMRQFSHPGTGRKEMVDINQALQNTIAVARNEWKYVADLETDFAGDLPPVSCMPGEMNQVFLNLLINAAHAIGELTEDGKKGKGVIRISTHSKNGCVQIRVSDTGGGIPGSIQTRIFDPFFTTKPVGKGTGQGLAIAHSVITEKHEGNIRFETGDGIGTTFIIELPVETAGEMAVEHKT